MAFDQPPVEAGVGFGPRKEIDPLDPVAHHCEEAILPIMQRHSGREGPSTGQRPMPSWILGPPRFMVSRSLAIAG